jgi:L-amino acid N-acyltransferase YncA
MVRAGGESDLAALTSIYNHYIETCERRREDA